MKNLVLWTIGLLATAAAPLVAQSHTFVSADDDTAVVVRCVSDGGDTECVHDVTGHRPVIARGGGRDGSVVFLPRPGGELSFFPLGRRGFLGVHVVDLTPELRRHFGVDPTRGVMVSRVVESSPAQVAGIEVGDILTQVGDQPVASSLDLKRLVAPLEDGSEVGVEVTREGRAWELTAQVEVRQARTVDIAPFIRTDESGRMVVAAPDVKALEPQFQWHFRRQGEEGEEVRLERSYEHMGRAFDEAMEAFHDRGVGVFVERELEERKELEAKLEAMERRLEELERRLRSKGD